MPGPTIALVWRILIFSSFLFPPCAFRRSSALTSLIKNDLKRLPKLFCLLHVSSHQRKSLITIFFHCVLVCSWLSTCRKKQERLSLVSTIHNLREAGKWSWLDPQGLHDADQRAQRWREQLPSVWIPSWACGAATCRKLILAKRQINCVVGVGQKKAYLRPSSTSSHSRQLSHTDNTTGKNRKMYSRILWFCKGNISFLTFCCYLGGFSMVSLAVTTQQIFTWPFPGATLNHVRYANLSWFSLAKLC